VQELGEATPHRGAFIVLDLEEPNPGVIFQITGNQPYLLVLHDVLSTEVGVALVDEGHKIRFPHKFREVHRGKALWRRWVVGWRRGEGGGGHGGSGSMIAAAANGGDGAAARRLW